MGVSFVDRQALWNSVTPLYTCNVSRTSNHDGGVSWRWWKYRFGFMTFGFTNPFFLLYWRSIILYFYLLLGFIWRVYELKGNLLKIERNISRNRTAEHHIIEVSQRKIIMRYLMCVNRRFLMTHLSIVESV